MNLSRKRSRSDDIQPSVDFNLTLLKHAELVLSSKVQRARMIDENHVKAYYESSDGAEFREFRKTGLSAKISNLKSVYTMYLNTHDK